MVFTSGIIGGIGSIYFAFKNGIMVGAFQYLFHTEDLLLESAMGIWMHGAFEIFSVGNRYKKVNLWFGPAASVSYVPEQSLMTMNKI